MAFSNSSFSQQSLVNKNHCLPDGSYKRERNGLIAK